MESEEETSEDTTTPLICEYCGVDCEECGYWDEDSGA